MFGGRGESSIELIPKVVTALEEVEAALEVVAEIRLGPLALPLPGSGGGRPALGPPVLCRIRPVVERRGLFLVIPLPGSGGGEPRGAMCRTGGPREPPIGGLVLGASDAVDALDALGALKVVAPKPPPKPPPPNTAVESAVSVTCSCLVAQVEFGIGAVPRW